MYLVLTNFRKTIDRRNTSESQKENFIAVYCLVQVYMNQVL